MDREAGPGDRDEDGVEGALAAAVAAGGAGAEKAEAYFDEAIRLTKLKVEQLEEERRFEPFGHFSIVMKAAFEAAIAVVVVLILVVIGATIWSAVRADGLVIEPFSVPADMASRGLTGQVVAARLLDRLSQMQAETVSNRAPSSYANNWGDDIKVEIPETGVSIGQAYDYLRRWLGHETRITGEIYRNADGQLSMAARVGGDSSPTVTGKETDLDTLMQKTAESVYRATQPYRYAVYLSNVNHPQEAEAAYRALIANGSKRDRAWAYIGIENIYQNRGQASAAEAALEKALAIDPDFVMAYTNLAQLHAQLQHDELALKYQTKSVELLRSSHEDDISETARRVDLVQQQSILASSRGDYGAALDFDRQVLSLPEFSNAAENAYQDIILSHANMHDGAGVRRAEADLPETSNPQDRLIRKAVFLLARLLLGQNDVTLSERLYLEAGLGALGKQGDMIIRRQFWPYIAYAYAAEGDGKSAHSLIDETPAGCVICIRQRGRIDALEKNWGGAAYWFVRAAAMAPTPPFVWNDWGQMLLAKGDYGGAIGKFRLAHDKGPHWADPLEGWGEALMKQNRSDLALGKFAAANQDAPDWGRLHLKWGEALYWSGNKAEARKQFARAAALDLTPAEKAELANIRNRHG